MDKYIEFSGTIDVENNKIEEINERFMDDMLELVESYGGDLFMFSKVKEELFADEDLQEAFDMLENEGKHHGGN